MPLPGSDPAEQAVCFGRGGLLAVPRRQRQCIGGQRRRLSEVALRELQLRKAHENRALPELDGLLLEDTKCASEVAARSGELPEPDEHPAQVVERPGLGKAVAQGLMNGERFLRIARRLIDLADLLVRSAHPAVKQRQLLE